jgi:chromosome segregation ATPase
MKAIDYINTLIKENDELKAMCKSHSEIIRLMKKELNKLNNTIAKKDKKIQKLETDFLKSNEKKQKEIDKVKTELVNSKAEFKELKSKYNVIKHENAELKRIFDEIDSNN